MIFKYKTNEPIGDSASEKDCLAVVVSEGNDCFFVRPRGRRYNAILKSHVLFADMGLHELKFGDMLVVDVEAKNGKDIVTRCRLASEEELASR